MDLRTNEQIDRINNFKTAHGQEILPYESAEIAIKNEGGSADADNKADEDAKEIIVPKEEATGLTKEQKEAIIREHFGVTDLADMVKKSDVKVELTEEEIEAAKDKRENDKVAYALSNGKFTKKQYEKYIADTSNPQALVLAQYTTEQKGIDPELSDEEILSEFNSKFGLDNDTDSRQYKRGVKEIGLLAEIILNQNYKSIIGIDQEFSAHENEQLTTRQINEKVMAQAPVYKQDVEDIYEALKTITIPFGADKSYTVALPQLLIDALKEKELVTEYATDQIKGGYTKEDKANTARMALIFNNLPMVIQSIADQINESRIAGAKGIPVLDGQSTAEPKKLTAAQQSAVDRINGKGEFAMNY